jgi:hypothetical protein
MLLIVFKKESGLQGKLGGVEIPSEVKISTTD